LLVPRSASSIQIREDILNPLHPDLALAYCNFGALQFHKGDMVRAEELYLKCLRIWETVLPPGDSDLVGIYGNLSNLYMTIGDFSRAAAYFRKARLS
jgi:tetratricopeptide (TPR) repeat protein